MGPEQFDVILLCSIWYVFDDPAWTASFTSTRFYALSTSMFLRENAGNIYRTTWNLQGCPKAQTIKISLHKCPHSRNCLLLAKKSQFDMSLVVLLAFDSYLPVKEIRILVKRKSTFKTALHTVVYLLLSETKTGAGQSVNVPYETVKALWFPHWQILKKSMITYLPILTVILGPEFRKLWNSDFSWGMSRL